MVVSTLSKNAYFLKKKKKKKSSHFVCNAPFCDNFEFVCQSENMKILE
jgi:hypothetical protein